MYYRSTLFLFQLLAIYLHIVKETRFDAILYIIKRFMTYLSSYKHFKTGSKNVAIIRIKSREIQIKREQEKLTQMFRQYFDRLLEIINRLFWSFRVSKEMM